MLFLESTGQFYAPQDNYVQERKRISIAALPEHTS